MSDRRSKEGEKMKKNPMVLIDGEKRMQVQVFEYDGKTRTKRGHPKVARSRKWSIIGGDFNDVVSAVEKTLQDLSS